MKFDPNNPTWLSKYHNILNNNLLIKQFQLIYINILSSVSSSVYSIDSNEMPKVTFLYENMASGSQRHFEAVVDDRISKSNLFLRL